MAAAGVQLFTLALAAFYCAVVYAFRVSLTEGRTQRERYVRLALVLAVASVGLAAAKAASALAAGAGFSPALAGVSAGLVAFAVVVLQVGAIRAAGAVTLQKELAAALVKAKLSTIALGALAGAPTVLLFTGAHPIRDQAMVWILAAEAVALTIWFLAATLRLFVRQKVSVLIWILYLCSVEVVPAWACVVLAGRII